MEAEVRVLLVEDERLCVRIVKRVLDGYASVHDVGTAREARAMLRDQKWDGVIIDVGLPDGSGLRLLEWMRNTGIDLPALVLTERTEREIPITALALRAHFSPKPLLIENGRSFVRILRAARDGSSLLHRVVMTMATSTGLSPREHETLLLTCAGLSKEEIAEAFGVRPSSVETYMKRIVKKTCAGTMRELVSGIHKTVFRNIVGEHRADVEKRPE